MINLKDTLRKYLSLVLVGSVLNLTFYSTAMANTVQEARFAEKVKAKIAKLGVGSYIKVKVKLKDGTKLKGYVRAIKDSSFIVMNEKTATAIEVPYLQIKQFKGKDADKIFTGANIGKTVVVLLAISVLFGLAYRE